MLLGQPTYNFWLKACLQHTHIDGTSYNIHVVVQFCPLFKFYFPFFQTHHTLSYPRTMEKK